MGTPFPSSVELRWNWVRARLYEEILKEGRGQLSQTGALVVNTVPYTGRSPLDKFLVEEPRTTHGVWWGEVNRPFPEDKFDALKERVLAYLTERGRVYAHMLRAGAHPEHYVRVVLYTESPWHALFGTTMFLPDWPHLEPFRTYTIYHAPYFKADPQRDGTRSEAFVLLHLGRGEILIGGTPYAGEIKKSIFTVLNYELPKRGVLSMHCSANYDPETKSVSLFFGLSGTGKTTLSMDTQRVIIGDDEHGWADDGVFNFEGGSYAKVIRISKEYEPLIYRASLRFGTILENVVLEPESRMVLFDDDRYTENTRAAFPLSFLPNVDLKGRGGHPKDIFFLTADAFGLLPPLARLTPEQARDFFLLGYTAKVAGTERGVKEPKATYSPCFGAPFLVHPPAVYADMLVERLQRYGATVWLLNTGWTGGPFGIGRRMPLPYTRAMVHAVQKDLLSDVPFEQEPHFGLWIPKHVPEVPDEVLRPWLTWQDKRAYEARARALRQEFEAQLAKVR